MVHLFFRCIVIRIVRFVSRIRRVESLQGSGDINRSSNRETLWIWNCELEGWLANQADSYRVTDSLYALPIFYPVWPLKEGLKLVEKVEAVGKSESTHDIRIPPLSVSSSSSFASPSSSSSSSVQLVVTPLFLLERRDPLFGGPIAREDAISCFFSVFLLSLGRGPLLTCLLL